MRQGLDHKMIVGEVKLNMTLRFVDGGELNDSVVNTEK
jgi:hypothetical protein